MWRMCMSILVSGWILTTPALWAHRWEQAVLSVLVGLAGIMLSPAAVLWPRVRSVVFALGAVRALSAFVFPDTLPGTIDALSTGLLLVIAGMYPEMTVSSAARAHLEPGAQEEQPFHRVAA